MAVGRQTVLVWILALALGIVPVFAVSAQRSPDGTVASETPRQKIIIRVDGASCPFCAFGLEKRIGRLDGVADVQLEMKEGKVIVTLEKGATVSEAALRQAVDEAGFTARAILYPKTK
ncbi:MAG: copper chaperone [Nitrospirae bacterium]|nr:MAG: copper chaperone [Nitrospirota bacterium]